MNYLNYIFSWFNSLSLLTTLYSLNHFTLIPYLKKLENYNIILGSGSPRRKELLQSIGLNFVTIQSSFEENLDRMAYQSAEEYCLDTARNKGYNIISEIENNSSIQKLNNQFLICADTIVEINSEILEKPKNVDDCYRMLSLLNDKRHSVHTAVIIFTNIDSNSLIEKTSFVETTSVNFSKISYSDILSYVEIDKPFDKSGSYGIQGLGGCFVKSIEGCYYNVMGLPISRLSSELSTILSSFEKSKE